MIYGRLDVYWPDGPMQNFELSKPSIAIGRAAGNDIALEEATAVSRYHANLTLRDGQLYLTDLDSINGTYIDGRKLDSNTPALLQGGEDIQIGEVRLIFHPADDSPTQPLLPVEATQRLAFEQPTYKVELVEPAQGVSPGVFVQGLLAITNLGDGEDQYFIEVDGVPREWVRLERVEVTLQPGEATNLLLSFKPLRKPDSLPGDYPVTVQVRSKSRPIQTVAATMTLRVLPYSGFGIDLGRTHVVAGEALPVHVHNQGNAPLQLSFAAREASGALQVSFTPARVVLSPGQRLTVRAAARPARRKLIGRAREVPVVILARAQNASGFVAPLPARLSVAPLLHGWRLGAALVGMLAIALLALALLAALLTPPAQPQITSLVVSAAEIVQGETVTVTWEAENADALYLEVDGERHEPALLTAQGSLDIALETPGTHEIALVAETGDRTSRSVMPVMVHPPLVIANFSASPATQVRYIGRDIVLTWQVEGGTRVQLIGIPGDGAELPVYGPVDSRQIRLDGTAALTITLHAEGYAGQWGEQTLTIPVEDPVCAVNRDKTVIRSGPSALHTVMGRVDRGQIVVPDRRDGSGQWLRVFATGDQRVWIATEALDCLNLDPLLLSVDMAPPTPVPSATPTASPPPTHTPLPAVTLTPTALPTATPPPVL